MEERTIDHLLEQYLYLLHEYTSLHAELNKLQAGLYQNLARANFAAERGMRYGQDQYDDRMQASRRVKVALPSSSVCPTFEVVKVEEDNATTTTEKNTVQASSVSKSEVVASEEGEEKVAQGAVNSSREAAEGPEGGEGMREETAEPIASSAKETKPKTSEPKAKKKSKDPLRWFGLITPMPLRQAQAQSVQAVEEIIPRLVSINAGMAQVEIEVRRARKKRAKAEAAARKSEDVASKEEVAV
ncbi:hypothetical protein PG996_002390 [Apiospora saccharicola]|uniref:Vacuolar ATPase assembly protein VMA22 n=1 Tax=Apiospora saccharicola TaxID=335842 RepID=A0ABR1WJE0_9PEZI